MSVTIGVDIGGTKIAGGIVGTDGAILARSRKETERDAREVVATIVHVVRDLVSVAERDGLGDVEAVGLGAPGLVDETRKVVRFAPNIDWAEEPLADAVASAAGLPTIVENDANAAAWGEFRFGAGRAANELTHWTGVSRPMVRVAPRAKLLVTLRIAVPATARAGERYGVVWAEVTAARTPRAGVTAVNRVGIRMYLSVGEGGEPASDFTIRSIEARRDAQGSPSVVAMVSNTGERALDLSGSLSLRNGPGGLSAGPFPADLGTTLGIGETEPVRIPVDRAVPAGTWSVRIDLRSGTVVRTATARVTFPRSTTSSSGPVVVAASAGGHGYGWFLWTVIVGLLVLVLGLGALLLTRRRSDAR